MKNYYVFDTSSLILEAYTLFENYQNIVIPSICLTELEYIKTSADKDPEIKQAVRNLLDLLDKNPDLYEIHLFRNSMLQKAKEEDLEINNDVKILMTAVDYDIKCHPDETIFVSNDNSQKRIANIFFGNDSIESVNVDDSNYIGYKEVKMNEDEMANFYSHQNENIYNLLTNEYLIVEDQSGNIVDKLCWTGKEFRQVKYYDFSSRQFGKVKPINDKLEHGEIDKIVVFCNTVATKNSAKLGYYPGSRDEKLLDSQIGNMLISKLGSRTELERMMEDETIILLPLSDIRGYDTTGMKAGVYISEAQNLDINMMKLALQRIGEDSICIIDGDTETQVDLPMYADFYNGMKRASKVYRGHKEYGQIKLQKIHRSRIAEIADLM